MPEEKVYEAGLLLRPAFFEQPKAKADADFLRKKWDLDPKLPLLVLGTGANGVNRHLPVTIATRALGEVVQVVALCGENRKTMRWLESMGDHSKVPLRPLPTIPAAEVAPLLRSATMLFARPGAGTTAEAIACGTPVLFDVSRGVMPQEQNNLSFWQKRTGGLASTKKASEVPRRLHSSSLPATFPYAPGETPLRFLEKLREIVASR
jgi:UDP-N-acetylglucosamine:LPS N-acetylglucosamine transferase